jgi:hypothetical protein
MALMDALQIPFADQGRYMQRSDAETASVIAP